MTMTAQQAAIAANNSAIAAATSSTSAGNFSSSASNSATAAAGSATQAQAALAAIQAAPTSTTPPPPIASHQIWLNILDFGGDPTGVNYNDTALANALASVNVNNYVYSKNGPTVYFPPGKFKFQKTIELKSSCVIEGGGSSGVVGGMVGSTILSFPVGVTGIIVKAAFSNGASTETTSTGDASGSIIRNIALEGGYNLVANKPPGTAHGIWPRTRVIIENVTINDFSGDGFHVTASIGGTGADYGNANGIQTRNLVIRGCGGHGLYLHGSDANAGTFTGTDVAGTGYCGIYDDSFLGNTHVGPQVASIGWSSQAVYNGVRYYCMSDTLGGTITPGTNAAVWVPIGPGQPIAPVLPAWVAGNIYGIGYAYRSGAYSRNVFIGPYCEDDTSPAEMFASTIVIGGELYRFTAKSNVTIISSSNQNALFSPFQIMPSPHDDEPMIVSMGLTPNNALRFGVDREKNYGTEVNWNSQYGHWMLQYGKSGSKIAARILTDLNTSTYGFGRMTPPGGGNIAFTSGIWLGNNTDARFQSNAAAPPTDPALNYSQGDYLRNTAPAVGKPKGWYCVASGNPGTWVSEGNL